MIASFRAVSNVCRTEGTGGFGSQCIQNSAYKPGGSRAPSASGSGQCTLSHPRLQPARGCDTMKVTSAIPVQRNPPAALALVLLRPSPHIGNSAIAARPFRQPRSQGFTRLIVPKLGLARIAHINNRHALTGIVAAGAAAEACGPPQCSPMRSSGFST